MTAAETVDDLLGEASAVLTSRSASPALDAELLLAHAMGCPRSRLFAWPEAQVGGAAAAAFRRLIERRGQGEPVAYLLGRREFWSLSLRVTADTLVPRPETESLVELALQCLRPLREPRLLDLGTGSGAIALALARERPDAAVVAVDVSAAALQVAQSNATELGIGSVTFRLGDWYRALPAGEPPFDLIVANPPYVASADPALAGDGVSYEPRLALVGGADGLQAIRHIAAGAPAHLGDGAWLVLEHGAGQGENVRALLGQAGLEQVETIGDHSEQPRVSAARAPATRRWPASGLKSAGA